MFEIKDLDLSHVTTLHLTLVESGAFYVDKLYGDEKTLSKVAELLKGNVAKEPEVKCPEESETCRKEPIAPDYSNSPLKNYLAHPEDVNRTLAWLHLHIDFQTGTSMNRILAEFVWQGYFFSLPLPPL